MAWWWWWWWSEADALVVDIERTLHGNRHRHRAPAAWGKKAHGTVNGTTMVPLASDNKRTPVAKGMVRPKVGSLT